MPENAKKPQIRFKGFTDAWEQRKLGDLGTVSMNKRIFKEQTSENGEIPFYKIGTFGGKADAYISRELFEEYKTKYPYPQKGDILISASGSIGRTVEFTGKDEYFQDSNIVWLNHHNRINNSFLKYFYLIVNWYGVEGSTIKRLYNDNILNTNINLPISIEQEKIGNFFNRIDNLITLHQRKLDKLKNIKKSMLEKMFPKNGSNVPEIRFKGFTDAWEQRKLREIATYKNGKSNENYQVCSGKYELINLNSVSIDGGLKHSGKFVDIATETLRKNDLVMILSDVAHGDLLGRVALIPENNKFVLNQRVALLRLDDSRCAEFLFSYINSKQAYFKSLGAGSSQLNISKDTVENFDIKLPSLEEQISVSKFFEALDNLITLHQRKLEKLKNIKKACLEKMFV